MTRREKFDAILWGAFVLALLLFGLVLFAGCTAAKETAKKDWQLTRDFTACDAEAKAIARSAPACSAAIGQLLDLMRRPECDGFGGQSVEGGIKLGGITYICHQETPRGE